MLVIILIVLQVMDTFLLFRLMKKGSFVTVQNKVIYVPAKKKKFVAPKPQPEDEEYDY
mgnify:FL=1